MSRHFSTCSSSPRCASDASGDDFSRSRRRTYFSCSVCAREGARGDARGRRRRRAGGESVLREENEATGCGGSPTRATRTSSSHSLESLRTVERSDGEGMKRSRDDGPGSSAVVKRCARETRSVKLVRAGGCVSCLVSSLVVANGRSDRRARDARRNGRRGNCTRDRRVESAPSLRPTDRPMPGWGRDDGAGRGSMDGS